MNAEDPRPDAPAELIADVRASVAFLTRTPAAWLGGSQDRAPDFRRASRMFPLVGAAVGLVGGAVLVIAILFGVPYLIAASLAVAATMVATGGLHEDGLADTVDGFGGGATRERKLAIMRDSQIGSYGAAALVFSILIRVGALWSLSLASPWRAGLALIAAEAVSRTAMMRAWDDLPSARTDGIAHEAGPPDSQAMLTALVLALAIALATVWPSTGLTAVAVAILLAAAATYILILIARGQIGGRTGDVLGACQQFAVASFLVGVASAA